MFGCVATILVAKLWRKNDEVKEVEKQEFAMI